MSAYTDLHYREPSLWQACQAVGGLAASDQRQGGRQISVKRHERLSATRRMDKIVNVRPSKASEGKAAPCAGYVKNSQPQPKRESKNARRKRQRYSK